MLKRVLIGLLAWLLSSQLAFAVMSITNTVNTVGTVSANTLTFGSNSIGTAATDRIVLVVVQAFGASAGAPSTFTASSGTIIFTQTGSNGCINDTFRSVFTCTTMWFVAVPTGTTMTTMVADFGANTPTAGLMSVYSITGSDYLGTPFTGPIFGGNHNTNSIDFTGGFTIPTGGGSIAGCALNDTLSSAWTWSWTGSTTDANATAGNLRATTVHSTTAGSPSPASCTVTTTQTLANTFFSFGLIVANAPPVAGTDDQSLPLTGFGN